MITMLVAIMNHRRLVMETTMVVGIPLFLEANIHPVLDIPMIPTTMTIGLGEEVGIHLTIVAIMRIAVEVEITMRIVGIPHKHL